MAYEEVYRSHADNKDLLRAMIMALVAAGRHDRAAQYALDSLHTDPSADRAVALLALALSGNDRVDEAMELARNLLLQTLNREGFQDLMIQSLRRAERYAECIDFIDALIGEVMDLLRLAGEPGARRGVDSTSDQQIAYRPNEPFSPDKLSERLTELRIYLAGETIAAKKFREAEESLMNWLEHAPDPATRYQYLLALATCYQAQGNDLESTSTLERALALQPDSVGLSNDVAYGWIDRGVRIDEAERLIRYAVARAPREGAYLDTYGWLLYKKGEFAEAKKWLFRASHQRSGQDPVLLDHLGDTCRRIGETEQAIEYWSSAMTRVRELKEEELRGADIRRVRDFTQNKIDAARAGRPVETAPLAEPVAPVSADGANTPDVERSR